MRDVGIVVWLAGNGKLPIRTNWDMSMGRELQGVFCRFRVEPHTIGKMAFGIFHAYSSVQLSHYAELRLRCAVIFPAVMELCFELVALPGGALFGAQSTSKPINLANDLGTSASWSGPDVPVRVLSAIWL